MTDLKLTVKEKSRIITRKSLDYVPNPKGLGYELFLSMLKHRHAVAQIDAETGESDTYESLLCRCIRTCVNLIVMGITKDDIICQCSGNHFNSCVPLIIGLFLGLKVVSLDPSFSFDETTHLLNQIRPRIIFVSPDVVELIEEALEVLAVDCKIVVFGQSEDYTEFNTMTEPNEYESMFRPLPLPDLKETAIILFTNKSGGDQKGICLSHYTLMVQLVNTVSCWNLGDKFCLSNYEKQLTRDGFKVVMGFETFYWLSAISIFTASTVTGITRIICTKFEPSRVWNFIDKYNIDFMLSTTLQAIQLYKLGKPEQVEGNSLQMLVTTGSSLSAMNLQKLRDLFPHCFITHIYEIPEIGGAISMYNFTKPGDIIDQYEKPTSCGRLLPGLTCKIVEPIAEKILGVNEPGELRYKCDFVMNGYHLSNTSSHLDKSGWIKTGDVILYDEKDCVTLLDPYQDMFKYKCSHVVPSLIENVIKLHPAVNEAVVVGIPHQIKDIGANAMGIVKLNRHMTNRVTEKDIEDFANVILHKKQKLRGGLKIVRDLPLARDGQPMRQKVKEMVLNGIL